MDGEAAQRLKNLAALEYLTLSEYGGVLLERGVTGGSDELAVDLVGVCIEFAIRREVARLADRLASLMVQATLEAGAARRLLLSLLVGQAGEEVAPTHFQQVWSEARDRLRTPMRELMGQESAP